jgi:hypothetical protein
VWWFFSRVPRVFRLTTYLMVVAFIGAMVAANVGYARMKGSALSFGNELERLTETTNLEGDFYKLRLNGEPIQITSARTTLRFEEVLDRYQDACKERADGLPVEFANLQAALQPGAPDQSLGWPGMGILRNEGEDRGFVLCFAQGGPTDYPAAFERLRLFGESGDLSKVGDLRYVFARATQNGSHVIAVWTKGAFEVGKMFPAEGDAPGTDVEGGYRPDGTRRVFTAFTEGVPYGIRIYEGSFPASIVLGQFDREMPAKGWQTLALVGQTLPSSRAFSRDGVDLIISVVPHQNNAEKSVISIVEMRTQ